LSEVQRTIIIRAKYFAAKQKEIMKAYSLDEVQDKLIGKIGTPERDVLEYELQMDLIGKAIEQIRQERHLTQEELGKLIGVQKAQISRLETNPGNVTMDTLIRVFSALKAKISFQVELPNLNISIGK
jgi:HTH-type transcriptional regulator / antitoxin HipB